MEIKMTSSKTFTDSLLLMGVSRMPYFFLITVCGPALMSSVLYYLVFVTQTELTTELHAVAFSPWLGALVFSRTAIPDWLILKRSSRQIIETLLSQIQFFTVFVLCSLFFAKPSSHFVHLITNWAVVCTLSGTMIHVLGLKILLMPSFRSPALRVLLVGVTPATLSWTQSASSRDLNIEVIGFVDSRSPDRLPSAEKLKSLGSIESIKNVCDLYSIDRVMIGLPSDATARIGEVIQALKDSTVSVYQIQSFDGFSPIGIRLEQLGDFHSLGLIETPSICKSWFLKSLMDRVIASILLVLLAPVFLITSLAIKMNSRGPVFFKQTRFGVGGEEFNVWKFRTMFVNEPTSGFLKQAQRGDTRITSVGNFLRNSSLDELPQLINVVLGQMSLVGPRPHEKSHNEFYRKQISGYMLRHKVKPGITGLAQIRGFRGETDTIDKMANRIRCDLEYLRNWSISLDLLILLRTPWSLIWNKQVY
jgi:putative colanic acid biosysnthesis UDP-glucose lipid carrier transferase